MPDTDRLAALLREAWDGWDGENPQPDDPHEWQAVCLRAAGVTLAAPTCCDLACYETEGCECDGCKAAPAEGRGKCGCSCKCHVDEDKPEWPGDCAGCCEPGMNCDCGRALAAPAEGREREAYEAGRLAGYEYGIDLGMGESFTPAAPAEGLDVERLARAIRTAEVRSQMGAQRMGAVPPDDGPLPDWYRAYAEDVAREYAALKRRPTDD